jgi:hypothetical protein
MKRILLILIAVLTFSSIESRATVTTQQLAWFRYYLKVPLKNDWKFRTELEDRAYMFPWHQHQFLFRSHMGKDLGKGWSGAFGMTFFWQTLPHDPEVTNYSTFLEFRIQQELQYKQKLNSWLTLSQRFWLEERIFEQPNLNGKPNGTFTWGTLRLRYAFGASFKLWQSDDKKQDLKLGIADEFMINFLGNSFVRNIFDQNRVVADLTYNVSPYLGFGVSYMNWYQQRANGDDFFNRHIFRFTIHHTLPTGPLKKEKALETSKL